MTNKNKLTQVILLTKTTNLNDFTDWMDWHLNKLRFDCCHIFDNESPIDIKSICDFYGDKVTYELVKGWPNQYALYNRYINNESPAWWVLPIDDDEFLWMKNFTNVNDMIMFYQGKWKDMTKLSIRWQNMFPKDPLADRGNKSLMEFNTETNEKWANLFDGGDIAVKTFVKTILPVNHCVINGKAFTHNPLSGGKSYLCNGEQMEANLYFGPKTDVDLKILHFQYKSKTEWIWKCNNRIDAGGKRLFYDKRFENNWEKMK